MTVDTGRPRRSGNGTSLRERPQGTARRPAEQEAGAPPPASEIAWSRVGRDRYEVTRSGRTLGFIDVEGGVFVALAGPRYDRAVEASQTLRFADAVRALEDRY
jgi:hypothetical protein